MGCKNYPHYWGHVIETPIILLRLRVRARKSLHREATARKCNDCTSRAVLFRFLIPTISPIKAGCVRGLQIAAPVRGVGPEAVQPGKVCCTVSTRDERITAELCLTVGRPGTPSSCYCHYKYRNSDGEKHHHLHSLKCHQYHNGSVVKL
jgi:hypothetical protein